MFRLRYRLSWLLLVPVVGVLQRGKIIATLSGPGECLTPAEYQQKIDDCLPWNYRL